MIKKIIKNPMAVFGFIVIIIFIILSLFPFFFTSYTYYEQDLTRKFSSPGRDNIFGCDELGRDIFTRIIYGGRVSLSIGIIVVSMSAFIGIIIGLISGFFGGITDQIIMRIIDIFLAFPGILLAIGIAAILKQNMLNLIIALTVLGWVGFARITRANVLVIKEMDYIFAVRSLGANRFRIVIRHIFPNVISPLIVHFTLSIAGIIIAESSLSFLGLGISPPYPSWGGMLSNALLYIREAPHMVTFPGVFIMLTVLSLNFIGDSIRDILDPRFKPNIKQNCL